jgi:hypothetical protein
VHKRSPMMFRQWSNRMCQRDTGEPPHRFQRDRSTSQGPQHWRVVKACHYQAGRNSQVRRNCNIEHHRVTSSQPHTPMGEMIGQDTMDKDTNDAHTG